MTRASLQTHHIDPAHLAALPRTSGVYIFQGEGRLPLYIGKSVDIRSRVMSHFRAPDEVRMMAQTRRIDVIETAGEIGALLLESRLVKQQNPLFNQRLRRIRSLCSLRLQDTQQGCVPQVVDGKQVDLGTTEGLYGLFSSRHAAQATLRELAQQHGLCLAVLGLEKATARGCFGLQIKTCLGACVGQEDRSTHDDRLRHALHDLRVAVWPFGGPIDVVETSGTWVQKHRIHRWCYVGTHCSKHGDIGQLGDADALDFDLDSYKILVKPILLNTVPLEVVAL